MSLGRQGFQVPVLRLRFINWLLTIVVGLSWVSLLEAQESPERVEAPGFKPPDVSDPLLADLLSAPRLLHSWEEAIAMLRSRAPTYLASYQGVLRAEAQERIARAAVMPALNGQAAYTHQFLVSTAVIGGENVTTPPRDVLGASAQLTLPLVNPRGLYGLGTAAHNTDLARLSLEEAKRELARQAVDAMLSSLASQRIAALNRLGLRAALERLELARARLRFGQSPQLDVDRAEQDVNSARSALLQGDETAFQAREQLGNLLGSSTPIAAAEDLDLSAFARAIVKTCRMNSDIEKQPQVAAGRARVLLAERAITDAELRMAPTLSVSSSAGYQSAVTLGPRAQWNVQGVLSVPFYDGGARYGAADEARALLAQAREELVAVRLRILTSVTRAQRAVRLAEAGREIARQQRDMAQRIDQRIRDGYARGVGTSLDLVISAQSLRQAETNLALLDFDFGKARAGAVLANAECVY